MFTKKSNKKGFEKKTVRERGNIYILYTKGRHRHNGQKRKKEKNERKLSPYLTYILYVSTHLTTNEKRKRGSEKKEKTLKEET